MPREHRPFFIQYIKKEGRLPMPSETLRLAAQIVMSHASMTELTPKELVEELKEIYSVLASYGEALEAVAPSEEVEAVAETVKKPQIPLKEIVKAKHVVCLECGKKLRTLKTHLRKAHNLLPKEYYQRYNLDRKKYPLVCKEYSEQRRKLAIDKGLGNKLKRKAAKPA
jgi:predicted transcriptional regulator